MFEAHGQRVSGRMCYPLATEGRTSGRKNGKPRNAVRGLRDARGYNIENGAHRRVAVWRVSNVVHLRFAFPVCLYRRRTDLWDAILGLRGS